MVTPPDARAILMGMLLVRIVITLLGFVLVILPLQTFFQYSKQGRMAEMMMLRKEIIMLVVGLLFLFLGFSPILR